MSTMSVVNRCNRSSESLSRRQFSVIDRTGCEFSIPHVPKRKDGISRISSETRSNGITYICSRDLYFRFEGQNRGS